MKSILIVLSFFIFSFSCWSQEILSNLFSKVRPGFYIGVNQSKLKSCSDLSGNALIFNGNGFNYGLDFNITLTHRMSLSEKFGLDFVKSGINIKETNGNVSVFNVCNTSINWMNNFKYYLPLGYTAYSFRLTAGPKLQLPIDRMDTPNENFYGHLLFSLNSGIGFPIFFDNFIIDPELLYSFGFNKIKSNLYTGSARYNQLALNIVFRSIKSRK